MTQIRKLILSSAVAVGCGFLGSRADASQVVVGATGWNQDIILAAADTAPAGYTTNVSAWDYYETGFTGGSAGLPTNAGASRTFTSAANSSVQFQFQPYTASNVLLLPTTGPAAGTLTLSTPTSFSSLQILYAFQGGGGGTWTATAHFSNSTTTLLGTFTDTDWTASPTVPSALSNTGLRNTNGSFYSGALSMPERDVSLSAADQAKTLTSIDFANTSGGTTNLMVFALSGNSAAPEPASLGILSLGAIGLLGRRRKVRLSRPLNRPLCHASKPPRALHAASDKQSGTA